MKLEINGKLLILQTAVAEGLLYSENHFEASLEVRVSLVVHFT
jgi:hypothetical protein